MARSVFWKQRKHSNVFKLLEKKNKSVNLKFYNTGDDSKKHSLEKYKL